MLTLLRQQPARFYRRVWVLAAPIVLQNLITTSLGFVDTFMVGMLGNAPMSAVTLANVPIFILQLFIFGLQSGSSVLISQDWGRGDLRNINRIIGVGLCAAGCLSLGVAAVLFFFPGGIMALVTNNPALQELGAPYLRIVGLSYIFNSLTSIYVGAHRSIGHPQLGAGVFAVSMLLNTGLNYVLIFGKFGAPALGVTGAAIATLASRIAEFLIALVYALGCRRLPLDFSALLRPGRAAFRDFARYSAPVICNETLWGLGNSMFSVIMGHMANSTDMVSAYTIIGYIDNLATVFVFGLAGATAVMVGSATGAGESRERIYRMSCALLAIAALVGLLVGLALLGLLPLLFRPVIFPLFQLTASGTAIASLMLVSTALYLPLRALNSTNVVGVLRGGGDVSAAMLIDTLPLWLVAVPVTALVARVLGLAPGWICFSYKMDYLLKCPAGLLRLRGMKWIRPVGKSSR